MHAGDAMRWALVFVLGTLLGAGCLSSIIPDHSSRSADAGIKIPDDGGGGGGDVDGGTGVDGGNALWLAGRGPLRTV